MNEDIGFQPPQKDDREHHVLPPRSVVLRDLESLSQPSETRIAAVEALMNGDVEVARKFIDRLATSEPELALQLTALLENSTPETIETVLSHPEVQQVITAPELYSLSPNFETSIKPKLEQVMKKITELRARYPHFVGITLYGSIHKGYFIEGKSDLDGKAIMNSPTQDYELETAIDQELLPFLFTLFPGERDVGSTNFGTPPQFMSMPRVDSSLWQGLFMGSIEDLVETRQKLYAAWQKPMVPHLVRSLVSHNFAINRLFERSSQILGEEITLSADELNIIRVILILKRMPNVEEQVSEWRSSSR